MIKARKNLLIEFLFCFTFSIIMIIYLINIKVENYDNIMFLMNTITFLLIIDLVFYTIFLIKAQLGIVTPASFFIYFCTLLHFGQVFMFVLFRSYKYDYVNYLSVYMLRDIVALQKTLLISYISIKCLIIGNILYSVKMSKVKNYIADSINLKMVGICLFVISFPFRFYLDLSSLVKSLTGGYSATWGTNLPGIFTAIGTFWFYSIIIIYLHYYKKNIKKAHLILFIGIVYLFITMLSGNRGRQIVELFTAFITYYNLEKPKINIRKIILLMIGSCLMLVFIDIIFSMRKFGLSYFFKNFIEISSNSFKINILLETLGTFGETLYTPFIVIEQVDSHWINPILGESFIYSLPTLIPNFGGLLNEFTSKSIFTRNLITAHALGGSFIGEMYYDFRNYYWVIVIILSLFISYISYNYVKSLRSKNFDKVIFILPFISNLLWWSRDSLGNSLRNIVWPYILLMILSRIKWNRK